MGHLAVFPIERATERTSWRSPKQDFPMQVVTLPQSTQEVQNCEMAWDSLTQLVKQLPLTHEFRKREIVRTQAQVLW